ncbi:MAG: sugar ABC transporter permease [Clostridiaceae bacterium]
MGEIAIAALMNLQRHIKRQAKKMPVVFFLIPSLSGFLLFFLLPFVAGLGYALTDSSMNGRFTGLKNILGLFANEAFLTSIKNTLLFMAPSVFLCVVLPMIAAILFSRFVYAKKMLRILILSPMAVPSATVALFWQIFFDFRGPLNHLLVNFGMKPLDWLKGEWGVVVVMAVYLWKNFGYDMIIYTVGVNNIPSEQYEAAGIDGAGHVRKLFAVTLPNLVPTIFFVITISIVNCFKVFRETYLIFGKYPNENVYMLQNFMNNMFLQLNYPKLTSAAYITAVFITAVLLVIYIFERRAS